MALDTAPCHPIQNTLQIIEPQENSHVRFELYCAAGEEIVRPCQLNVISIRVTLAAAKNDIVWDHFGNGGNVIREQIFIQSVVYIAIKCVCPCLGWEVVSLHLHPVPLGHHLPLSRGEQHLYPGILIKLMGSPDGEQHLYRSPRAPRQPRPSPPPLLPDWCRLHSAGLGRGLCWLLPLNSGEVDNVDMWLDKYVDTQIYLHPVSISCYLMMFVLKQSAAPVTELLVTFITRLRMESVQ